MELAFLELASQSIITEARQDFPNVSDMFFQGVRENQDVIEIDNTEKVEEFTETIVGIGLERRGRVGKTKRHDKVFEKAISCSEGRLPFIALGDSDLVVGVGHVEAHKIFGILEAIEEF